MGCCKSKDALLGQSKAELEACRGLLTEFNSTPEAADIKMASEDMINAINNLLLGPDDQVARLVEDAQACLTELRAVLPKLPEGVEIDKGKANDEFAKRLEVAIGGYQTAITEKLTTPGEGAEGEASVGSKENKHWVETSEEMQHLRKMREEIGRNGGFLDAITASLNEEGSSGGAWFQQGQAEAKKWEGVRAQMQLLHDTLMRFDTFDNSGKFVEPADWRNDWATAMECLKQTLRLLDPHFDLTWQETSAPKYPNHWREGMLNTQFKSVCYASEKEPPELQDVIVGADRIRLSEDGRLCRIFDKTLRRLWLLVDLLRVVHGVCSSKMSWFRGTPAAPQAATQAPWFQASQAAQQLELGPELRGSHPGGPQKHDHAGLQQQQMVSAVRQDDVAQVHSAQPVTLSHSTPQMQQVQLGRPAPVDTSAPATAPPPVYNPEQLNQACATKFCSMTQGADTLDQLAFQKAFIEPADPAKGKAPTEAQIQLTQRLFRALDKDNDGRISFEEYHEAMRVYHNGTFEERAELVWNVYAGSEDEVLSDSLKQVSKGCLDMVKNDVMSRECLSPVHRDLLASTEEQELEDSLNQSIVSLKGEIDAMPGTSPTRSAPGGFLIQKDAFIQMCKKSATMQVGVNPAYSPSGGLSPGQPGFIQTHGGYQDAAAPHAFGQQSLNRTT